MGALISTKNNKRDTKENRNIQNKRDIKLPTFKMKF